VADEAVHPASRSDRTLESTISAIKRRMPGVDSVAVVDTDKNSITVDADSIALYNNVTPPKSSLNLSAGFECEKPCIRRPMVSPWTGKLVIPMMRRIPATGSGSHMIALVTIDIELFKTFYRSLSIGQEDRIFLDSEDDYTFLARPSDNALSGRPISNRQVFESYRSDGPVGSILVQSTEDGVHRLYSYRRLASFPLFVMVGISRDDLLARWWRDVAWNLGATVALVFAVALVALHFVRQSRLRASAEERTEEALALSGRISGVSAYLESAREEERKRIALEVHDQLGQSLTALKIEAFLLKRPGITPADAARSADEMLDMIDGTIATVRHVSNALRPVALDYGIVAALKWLTTDFTARNRIACAFQHRGEVPLLDEMVATAIFRLAQGALTNIIRHAHARSVRVYWSNEDDTLSMSIIDDGCGFDVDASLEAQSYGLLSMRERARMCGGNLSIESAPGFGTTVSLIIPSGAF
jgi:signal transduction histidine kinase